MLNVDAGGHARVVGVGGSALVGLGDGDGDRAFRVRAQGHRDFHRAALGHRVGGAPETHHHRRRVGVGERAIDLVAGERDYLARDVVEDGQVVVDGDDGVDGGVGVGERAVVEEDAVGVGVGCEHGVGEHQRVAATAAHIGRVIVARSGDFEAQPRSARDGHWLAELHLEDDQVACPVGV